MADRLEHQAGNVENDGHLNAARYMREAASAIRLAAQSPEPVTVKPLVWVDHRPDSFPEPAWSAQTPFGFYNIEEVSASDCPAYVVRLHAHRFVADKDSLDAAKAAAQADYEQRIRSALVNVPMSASDGALREALEQIRTVCIDNAGDTVRHDLALKFIGKIASRVLAASEATKSDGGMKIPFGAMNDDPSAPGFKPVPSDLDARLERLQDEATDLGYVLTPEPEHPDSPHSSDTRPADVTVDELAQLIIKTVETSAEGCSNGVWVNAHPAARALLDTYKIGAK
ncbi:hypothetical protein [Afipia carboxidovorans]|uniref:hypothetical protein n=1 Tax=Afipia carboxidovorans TaxID=40137 RepID=UPI001FCC26B0|nr:hypothetical protein [Afipia carboxidovorans]